MRPLVEEFLKERGLTLSAEKTRLTHIDDGFDFLGQNLRKYDGKALTTPSKKNTHAFLKKVRGIIDADKSVSQTVLVNLLNPVIRGWANYHRHIPAKESFGRVDHEIWQRLWQWARRRHPKKSRDWVKRRYFPNSTKRAWDFAFQTGKQTSNGSRYGADSCTRATPKSGVMLKSDRPPTRSTQNGGPTSKNVRSLKSSASLASTPGLNRRDAGSARAGLCCGLSRMRGNSHVRF